MMGVFACQVIGTHLSADVQVLLDPLVFLDFAFEDFFRRFEAAARQVFSLGHDADANAVVVLGNVPKPAFFRDIGNGCGAGINALVAFGALVIGPDGDLVEEGIFDAPIVANGTKSFFAATIQSDGGAIFGDRTAFGLGARLRR